MKRIVTAIIFLLGAVAISLVGYFNLCKITDNLINNLYTVIDASENQSDEIAVNAARECVVIWDKADTMLEIYLDHNSIDDVEIDFKSIERYAEGDREIMLTEVCYECINCLEHIKETSTPSWGTIM